MKHLFRLFCCLLLLSSCTERMIAKRSVKRAERAAADEALRVSRLPAKEQLAGLVEKNPGLIGETTKVVEKTVIVKVPGETITVTVPAKSTPATDKTLVDSLLQSASHQLHQADSASIADLARTKARLAKILHERPLLSRDTVKQEVGDLIVKAWVDPTGVVHVSSISKERKVEVPTIIKQGTVQPIRIEKPSFWAKLWLILKSWFWLLLFLVVAGLVWLIRRRQTPRL
ncbi:hypothetical protein [Hymenobacter fodinae]|uniref:Uncharacterized protein n=1 Tax=Hymenobacter fodinae TaxID=2510796 RepID=A0A4Z0P2H3_9BACT|nr:hypothetical protein [Hymenobacter fodinae]TGE05544.1 hypothetical protein EU556_19785 [Hymenobacter fodinae]